MMPPGRDRTLADTAIIGKVVAVVPVFNHERPVPAVASALRAHGLRVILVDDGSHDTCRRALEALTTKTGDTLVRLDVNGGKGAAVIAGLRAARAAGYTHALQVDADGQHDLNDVPLFLHASAADPAAVVCGKPVFDESIPRVRLVSRYITHVLVWITTLSFREIRDSMCGFRLYPIDTVLQVVDRDGIGRRMDFDVELLVKLSWRGCRLVWLDTKVRYPADGLSHYRLLFDNLLLARMHVILLLGMIWRAPRLIGRRIARAVRPGAR
jgi:glycosyltransferase involved in cell wall biosynthesis